MKKNKYAIISLIFVIYSGICYCQGDLMVAPTRIVIDKAKQTKELMLVNSGKDTAVYSISFVQKKMSEKGDFSKAVDGDTTLFYAEPYLRIFPRKVVLAPKESQALKISFIKQSNMNDGEYRSHLYFRDEKKNKPLSANEKAQDSTVLSVNLIPIFGISIPVIIRVGKLTSEVSLSDFKIETKNDSSLFLSLTLNRKGNKSVYGSLKVDYQESNGKSIQIGIVNGLAVYPEIEKRIFKMRLEKKPEIKINKGTVTITYTDQDKTNNILAKETIDFKE